MTKEEHIHFLLQQADDDLGAAHVLQSAGYFGHALFWLHLVFEKTCKALWIHKNDKGDYPHVHNLLRLLKESAVELKEEQVEFYSDMNRFQTKGRYADTLHEIEVTVSKEICEHYFAIAQMEITWLKKQLQ